MNKISSGRPFIPGEIIVEVKKGKSEFGWSVEKIPFDSANFEQTIKSLAGIRRSTFDRLRKQTATAEGLKSWMNKTVQELDSHAQTIHKDLSELKKSKGHSTSRLKTIIKTVKNFFVSQEPKNSHVTSIESQRQGDDFDSLPDSFHLKFENLNKNLIDSKERFAKLKASFKGTHLENSVGLKDLERTLKKIDKDLSKIVRYADWHGKNTILEAETVLKDYDSRINWRGLGSGRAEYSKLVKQRNELIILSKERNFTLHSLTKKEAKRLIEKFDKRILVLENRFPSLNPKAPGKSEVAHAKEWLKEEVSPTVKPEDLRQKFIEQRRKMDDIIRSDNASILPSTKKEAKSLLERLDKRMNALETRYPHLRHAVIVEAKKLLKEQVSATKKPEDLLARFEQFKVQLEKLKQTKDIANLIEQLNQRILKIKRQYPSHTPQVKIQDLYR